MNSKKTGHVRYLLFIALTVLFTSCSNDKPVPINTRQDNCAFCKMGITNMQFASELITSKGKVYKFDSIECMASYYEEHKKSYTKAPKLWVHDFLHPDKWMSIQNAVFIKSDKIHSPMGMDLIAVKNDSEWKNIKQQFGGSRLHWSRLLTYVKNNMNQD